MAKGKWIPINSDGTVSCGDCGIDKPYTNEYFPYQIKKEGKLLKRCKPCQLIRTKKHYRENPEYFVEYREEHWDTGMRDYTRNWMKKNLIAKYNCKVYKITAPDSDNNFYIGVTQYKYLKQRLRYHKRCFVNTKGRQKLLHDSFEKYGFSNHKIELIEELGLDRDFGNMRETYWINKLGATLNIRKVKTK